MVEALKDNFRPGETESEDQIGGKKWLDKKLGGQIDTEKEDPDYDGGIEREESEDMTNMVPEKLDIGAQEGAATDESDDS